MNNRKMLAVTLILLFGSAPGCRMMQGYEGDSEERRSHGKSVVPCEQAAAELETWLVELMVSPDAASEPAASDIDERLRAITEETDTDTAVKLLALAVTLSQDCPRLERAFQATLQASRADRARILSERVAPAIANCGCSVDMAAMKALLWTYATGRLSSRTVKGRADFRAWLQSLKEDQETVPRPAASSIDAELRKIGRAADRELVEGLARLSERLFKDCPEAHDAFLEATRADPPERPAILVDRLPSAIEESGCSFDTTKIRALIWTLLTGEAPTPKVGLPREIEGQRGAMDVRCIRNPPIYYMAMPERFRRFGS